MTDPRTDFIHHFLEEAPHIRAVLTAAGEVDSILSNPDLSGNTEDVMAGLVGEAERALVGRCA